MSTILKWAGNKTAIMSELKKHLPAGPRLVEPFAGSCAVMMETDYPCYLVADINPDLINLYKKVAADCESFISFGFVSISPSLLTKFPSSGKSSSASSIKNDGSRKSE